MKQLVKTLLPKALRTAAVVGSVLVLINQFEAVYGDESINGVKLGLTYLVPFMVYLYSAISNTRTLKKSTGHYGIEKA